MPMKTLCFASILVAAMAASMAQAQLLGLMRINGTVPCSIGSATSTATAPAFPNALVQLNCRGTVVSSTTTNTAGVFTMFLSPETTLLPSLLNECKLEVNTPLSTCNPSLSAAGILQSPLKLITGLFFGLLGGIIDIIPTGFSLAQ